MVRHLTPFKESPDTLEFFWPFSRTSFVLCGELWRKVMVSLSKVREPGSRKTAGRQPCMWQLGGVRLSLCHCFLPVLCEQTQQTQKSHSAPCKDMVGLSFPGATLSSTPTLQAFDSTLWPVWQHPGKMSLLYIFFTSGVMEALSLSPKLLNYIRGHFWGP